MQREFTFGWFGKLPSAGDFINRGLHRETVDPLDQWLQAGLTQMRLRLPDWQSFYMSAPLWCFAIPEKQWGREPLVGCIVPSADRVGRFFPLVVASAFESRAEFLGLAPPAGRLHERCADLMDNAIANRQSADELDDLLKSAALSFASQCAALSSRSKLANDILDVLGTNATPLDDDTIVLTSADKASRGQSAANAARALESFDLNGNRSVWWTQSTSRPLAQTHDGSPNSQLFVRLFTQSRSP